MDGTDRAILAPLEAKDDTVVLRRILTVPKLVTLLSEGLRFSPASMFKDAAEGHYPKPHHDDRDRLLARMEPRAREMAHEANYRVAVQRGQAVQISCWSAGSLGLRRRWEEYASAAEGVAVETTVGLLRKALGDQFLLVPVRYIDFRVARIPLDHSLQPFVFKGLDHAWEEEVRILGEMERGTRIGSSRVVRVDLNAILTGAVVAPEADDGFYNRAVALFRSTGLMIPVHR